MGYKQLPEDFKVDEIIKLPSKTADRRLETAQILQTRPKTYVYFWLTKKNYTTVRAILSIAKALNVSFTRFHYAGTKDANAITRQLVSVFQIPPERLANLHLKDIGIEVAGLFPERLALGDLTGNKFEIVLRDLKKSELNNINEHYLILNRRGFPNYFGEQRFGGGNSHLIGREIIRGYFRDAVYYLLTYSERDASRINSTAPRRASLGSGNKEAGKFRKFAAKNFGMWDKVLEHCPKFLGIETTVLKHLVQVPNDFAGALRKLPKPTRRMYVHAYQSYLWNAGLANVNGKLRREYAIPGFKTKLGRDSFSKKIKELLEKDNLTLTSFKCASMPELASEGASRPAFAKVKHFEISEAQRDELNKNKYKIILKFELPKGAYATELVKFLTMEEENKSGSNPPS